jgi:hypothetical protein
MLRVLLIVTVVTMFTYVPTIYTQVPPTLSYQGMLNGSDNNPVEDGIYEMHFNLYGEADPSTPLMVGIPERHGGTRYLQCPTGNGESA